MAKKKKKKICETQHPTCKLSQKIIDEMCAIVRKGNFRTVARQRLGISTSTYDDWVQSGKRQIREVERGERKNLLLQGKLVLALDEAEGIVHGQMVEDILEHGSIQARQWYLVRRFNKLYSLNPNAHIDDETGRTEKADSGAALLERLLTAKGEE